MFPQIVLSAFLFTFVIAEGLIHEELRKQLCDTEGDFRGEFVKCLNTMPSEIQSVITMCGCIMQNETSCEYSKIIEDMCAEPDHAQNVSQCMKLFMKHNHSLEFDDEDEHDHHHPHHQHDHSDKHDHSQHDHDNHDSDDEHEEEDDDEEEEVDEIPSPEDPTVHKDCLKELYSLYNITWKEDESTD